MSKKKTLKYKKELKICVKNYKKYVKSHYKLTVDYAIDRFLKEMEGVSK